MTINNQTFHETFNETSHEVKATFNESLEQTLSANMLEICKSTH
jgi:hypothetical protein